MMISLPFPPPSDRNLQQYAADYQISDTVSESSDNASLLSLSQSDLAALGAGHIREDVRVSRKKLEALILKERETNPDRNFMESLMDRTNTYIQWPSRMKIGAKTKKDLYVRIYGHDPDEVNDVKMIVLAELGPHRDLRITLKMEISYTDHSHLIGCRGATIRRVMEDTGCHIHFPDSNRMSKEVKSNQVTIAGGSIGAVEQARSRVREQSPLIYQFTLPLITTSYDNLNQDSYSVFMDNINQTYNVQVTTHPPNKLQQTMVSVKGCECNAPMIKEAITKIINFCSNGASLTSVTVESTMEISAVRHGFVRAVNDSNVHAIMINTGAKIIFPDLSDGNIQQIKRSKVFIAGDINAVYFARQQLIGCLPLRMIFDLSDDFHLDWEFVRQIGTDLNVNVKLINRNRTGSTSGTTGSSSLPPPVPGRSRTIQIEAAERNTGNIYEARRRILGGGEPPAIANIPVTYGMRQSMPPGLFPTLNGSRYNPVPSSLQLPPLIPSSPSLVSPILSPSFWPPTPFNSPFAMSPIQTHCIMPGMTTPTGQMPQNNNNGNSSSRGQGIGQHGLPPIRISLTPGSTPTSDFPSSLGPPPGLYDHHGQNQQQQHMQPQPQYSPIFNHGNHPSNQMHSQHNGHYHQQNNNQSQMQFTFPRRERNEFFRDFEPQRRAPGCERRSNSQPNFLLSTANKNLMGGSNGNLKLSNLVSSPSLNKLTPSNAPLQLLPPIINGTNSSSVSVSSLSASSSTSSLIALQNKAEHNRDSPLNLEKDNEVKIAGISAGAEILSINGEKDPEFHSDVGVNDRKYLALKAMYETRIGNSPRVPNAEWAGMGFSRTHTALFPVTNSSPEASKEVGTEQNKTNGDDSSILKLNDSHDNTIGSGANGVELGAKDKTNLEPPKQELPNGASGITRTHSPLTLQISNLLDFSGNTLIDAPDLPSLFIKNGLEKYIDNFLTEEIDLANFQTLVEKDLRSLGVSSYPARKRMLLLISQLKLSSHNYSNNNRPEHPLWN